MEIITLHDPAAGTSAKILAGFGFNCYSFQVAIGGRLHEVLWAANNLESGQERPSGSGIPILFPFPGRLTGTVFTWQGVSYQLREGDARGNAIHGFVHERPWRVLEKSATRVVGQFQASVDDPELLRRWPADFRLTATYTLSGNGLVTEYLVENPDQKPLPCGLGTHPYFRVPIGGTNRDDCRVQLPVTRRWELVNMLPTGRRLPVENVAAFREGLRFGEMKFDDVFSGLAFQGPTCAATIFDPSSERRLKLTFDQAFRECVVYNPGHREAVCIEPYTCCPDAFRLAESGVDAGGRVLAPGESFRARVEIVVR